MQIQIHKDHFMNPITSMFLHIRCFRNSSIRYHIQIDQKFALHTTKLTISSNTGSQTRTWRCFCALHDNKCWRVGRRARKILDQVAWVGWLLSQKTAFPGSSHTSNSGFPFSSMSPQLLPGAVPTQHGLSGFSIPCPANESCVRGIRVFQILPGN